MSVAPPAGLLEPEQIKRYGEQGYLLVADLLTQEEIDRFQECERALGPAPGPRGLQNHQNEEHWANLAKHHRVSGIVRQLLDGPPQIVQTMYLAKAPEGGTGVALHQDTHYIRNEPNTLMACWIALSDTGSENGGFCVLSGSNHGGLRDPVRVTDTDQHASWEHEYQMRDPGGREWTETMHSFDLDGVARDDLECLTVPAGSGVFFTGMTVHGSYANESADRERLAFATHYVREGTWVYRVDIQNTVPA